MREKVVNKFNTWLFNPFHYIAGGTTLIIGMALLVITAIWAPFIGITFDGALHLNIVSGGVINELMRQLVIITVMTGSFWVAAKFLSDAKFRLIDLASTQMVARWPIQFFGLIIYSLPVVKNAFAEMYTKTPEGMQVNLNGSHVGVVSISSLAGLIFAAWTVALMYKSFSVSCNSSGGSAIKTFSVMLIIGHFLSVIIIASLPI